MRCCPNRILLIAGLFALIACATAQGGQLSNEALVNVAKEAVKQRFPTLDLTKHDTQVRDAVRVRFIRMSEPGWLDFGGGVDVILDPGTGRVISIQSQQ